MLNVWNTINSKIFKIDIIPKLRWKSLGYPSGFCYCWISPFHLLLPHETVISPHFFVSRFSLPIFTILHSVQENIWDIMSLALHFLHSLSWEIFTWVWSGLSSDISRRVPPRKLDGTYFNMLWIHGGPDPAKNFSLSYPVL